MLRFLTGKKVTLRLNRLAKVIEWARVKEIMALGISGFMMQFTNGLVQIFCNSTLHMYGGDIYVGVMTVLNSVRDIATMMVHGLTNGASPVMRCLYGKSSKLCRNFLLNYLITIRHCWKRVFRRCTSIFLVFALWHCSLPVRQYL